MQIPKISKTPISTIFASNSSKNQTKKPPKTNFDIFEASEDITLTEFNSFLNQENNDTNSLDFSVAKNIFNAIEKSTIEALYNRSTRKNALKSENLEALIEGIIEKYTSPSMDKKYIKEYLLFKSKSCFEKSKDNPTLDNMYGAFIFAFLKSLIKENDSFENKINLFKREFLDYANANDTLSLSYIQDLVQAFSPKTKVKKQSFLQTYFSYQSGRADETYICEKDKDKITTKGLSKTLYIQADLDKDSLIRSFVHEMTHILQYEAPEKSYIKVIESKANENPKDIDSLFSGEDIFYSSEDKLFSLFYKIVLKDTKQNQEKSEIATDLGDDFVKKIDEVIEQVIRKYGKKTPNFNLKAALSITRMLILSEIEAYQNEMSFDIENIDQDIYLEHNLVLKMYAKMLESIDKRLA